MNSPNNLVQWINRRVRIGWILLASGLVVGASGVAIQLMIQDLSFNPRIITGLGFLLIGLGVGNLARYGFVRNDPQATRRLAYEARDERLRLIRSQAGHRAFWVTMTMVYALLMWVSYADIGHLPALTADALWYYLAAVVVLSFGVYVVSQYYDNKHS